MPTHIILALGMWEECVSSNIDSWESSEARVKRLSLGSDDRGYLALWWMQYGYLRVGRFDEARQRLAVIEHDAKVSGARLARGHHAYTRSQFLIDTEQWDLDLMSVDADGIDARGWGSNALAEGMRTVKTGDTAAAERWLARLRDLSSEHAGRSRALLIVVAELEGLLLLEKKPKANLEKLRAAAAMEGETAFGYGPTFPAKPAFELLGDALLDLDRPEEAAQRVSPRWITPRGGHRP